MIYFPKTNLQLNIFEQRYLDLVNDAYNKDKLMGMVQSQKRGDAVNPIVSGNVMEIYGMPVYPSTDWSEGGVNISGSVFKRESVYYAEQFGVRSQSAYDIDHLATSVVVDMLFGATLSHPEAF